MISFNASVEGLDVAIWHISRYRNHLQEKLSLLANKLAEIGVNFMRIGFRTATYDGSNDAFVNEPAWVSDTVLEIPVTGSTVAFIEFGTGVTYADDHPKAHALGAVRGGYGKGMGKHRTWKYKGEPGSLGWYQSAADEAKGLVSTHGNPANAPMYNAAKSMRMQILDIARSVFSND